MSKNIKAKVRLQIPAGGATPAPPVGSALGPHGVNLMGICKEFNDKTKDKKGSIIPIVITIFEDRSFEIEYKISPVTELIKKATGLSKGSSTTGSNVVGTITDAQITEIAQTKMEDLNTIDLDSAKKIVAGTARSMGLKVA